MSTLTSLVLLFSYHTSTAGSGVASAAGTVAQAPTVAGSSSSGSSDSSSSSGSVSGSSSSDSPSSSSSGSSSSGTSSGSTTYSGDTVQTRWGPVQVQITVENGTITKSEAVVYPNGNHEDAQINGYALPILDQEVVQQQSASIDMVSGATVTSEGYLQSLQSAIDQAHL
nr:FMN-binding protein [Knoellia sp. DB2414S]